MKNFGFSIILLLNLILASYFLIQEKKKTAMLKTTIESLVIGNTHNSDSSIIEGVVKRLNLKDIKKFFPELKRELKAQGIKINTLEQYQKTQLEVNAKFQARVKQIITENDTSIINQYTDKWISYMNQFKLGDTTSKTEIIMPVPIQQAIFQDRKPFLFWRFKPVKLNQKMWTDNPYAKLQYNEVLEVNR